VVAKEKPLATSPIVLVLRSRSRSLDAGNATPRFARQGSRTKDDDEGRGRLGWIKDLEGGGAGRGGAGFDA
jgi:hypothetical protein